MELFVLALTVLAGVGAFYAAKPLWAKKGFWNRTWTILIIIVAVAIVNGYLGPKIVRLGVQTALKPAKNVEEIGTLPEGDYLSVGTDILITKLFGIFSRPTDADRDKIPDNIELQIGTTVGLKTALLPEFEDDEPPPTAKVKPVTRPASTIP